MALLMKNGIVYAKSDKIYTRVFEKELLGGQSTVIFTDELIVPDSTVKFYSSDKDMVLISKKITGHTLKAVVYSTKITHNVKVKISTPHSSINPICYGYRMNNSVNNPDNCITYLEDAEGMTPAAMNFSTGVFNYGSWENAFFMPRPCMLNYNGTVAYYLDKNDYSKKEDGTPSDVANLNFPGNAMMEWGQNGQKIWYKIVPDDSDSGKSANIYIANMKLDNHFEAWPFYDYNGHLINHFYTGIYQASVDSSLRIRSLSGMDINSYYHPEPEVLRNWTCADIVYHCELNNLYDTKNWYCEQYCDDILINLLTVLITKSNNVQGKIGMGLIGDGNTTSLTGTLDDKGMFYGTNTYESGGTKIFGMEHYVGNTPKLCAGYLNSNNTYKYKLTRSIRDGSGLNDYTFDTTTSGYLQGPAYPTDHSWGRNVNEVSYYRYNYFPTGIAWTTTGRYAGDNVSLDQPEITSGIILTRGSWAAGYSEQTGLFYHQTKTDRQYITSLSCKPERK